MNQLYTEYAVTPQARDLQINLTDRKTGGENFKTG